MKYLKIFMIIATVVLIAVFSVNCRKDSLEQKRIKYAKIIDANLDEIKVWAHGPRNTYVTYLSERGLTEDYIKLEIAPCFIGQLGAEMIELGFTKLYYCSGNIKVEFYVNRKEHCWDFK